MSGTTASGPWPERTWTEDGAVKTAFRVRYAETDKMGVAYYANYLVWFEVMRGDYMRARGFPYTGLEAEGIHLPIAEARVRYHAPARYDDVLVVTGRISEVRSRSLTFEYDIHRDGQLLARGSTRHIPVDSAGRPRQFSRELLATLQGYTVATADTPAGSG